jgi:hypothetical protein
MKPGTAGAILLVLFLVASTIDYHAAVASTEISSDGSLLASRECAR